MNRNHEWEKKRAEKVNVKDAKIVNHEPQITGFSIQDFQSTVQLCKFPVISAALQPHIYSID